MNSLKSKLLTVIITLVLIITSFTAYAAMDNLIVIEKKNINIVSGQVFDLSLEDKAKTILRLTEGAIVIKYKSKSNNQYQSLLSVSNSTNGNQDRYFHLYVTPNGDLGMKLRNENSDFKYTMIAHGVVNPASSNIIAFKGDNSEKNYKLFANGVLVGTLEKNKFKFF